MKKRILSLALTLVMVMTFLPNTSAKAAATYDVDAAIAYAKAHWNDGVGMCAEFVSKCVKAGGINMKVIATTKSCINAISSASGLPLVEVKLDSKGYALKSANSGILSAGDPVIQKCVNPNCADYGKHPHIMLCGGFDSQGRATFYGHTAAINNKVQQLNVNEAYNHTKACTMKVYTVHLASLDKGGSTTVTPPVTSPNVQFTLPTDSNYTSKQKVTNTNAVVVNKITKPSGTTVSQMGVILYDANGKQLKKYTEKVSNVGASTKVYHSWYDINSEVKYTLTPGTTYKYKFWGTFNGVDVISSTAYSFKTTGTAPAQTYTAKIYLNSDCSALYTQSVTQGKAYGNLPTAYGKDGYTFSGYYTAKTGGTKVTSSTIFNGTSDITLYPRYTQNVVEEPEVPQQYTVYLYMNGYVYKTLTVTNGSTYGTLPSPNLSGYDFLGWYTKVSGGTKVTSSTKVNLTGSQTLYARFEAVEVPTSGNIILQINNPTMYINGRPSSIDAQGTVPVIRNDRTLLPVRAVFEAMGGTVGWDNDTRIVTLNLDGKILYLQIGTAGAIDGDLNKYYLDTAPVIINNRTMLPIRFIVEFFDGTVEWDGDTRTVLIRY